MASSNDSSKDHLADASEADLAQVWKDLQKGEKTAQVLESNLTSLEKKIDDLLASFEEAERRKVDGAKDNKHVLAGGASSEKGDDSTEKP